MIARGGPEGDNCGKGAKYLRACGHSSPVLHHPLMSWVDSAGQCTISSLQESSVTVSEDGAKIPGCVTELV